MPTHAYLTYVLRICFLKRPGNVCKYNTEGMLHKGYKRKNAVDLISFATNSNSLSFKKEKPWRRINY